MNEHQKLLSQLLRSVERDISPSEHGAVATIPSGSGNFPIRLESFEDEHVLSVGGRIFTLPALTYEALKTTYDNFLEMSLEADTVQLSGPNGDLGQFTCRVVMPGGNYGLERKVVNDSSYPIVEIYDNTYARQAYFEREGQIIGQWAAKTLLKIPPNTGLAMQGDIPEWTLDASAVAQMREWLGDYFHVNPVPAAPANEHSAESFDF